ncbi:amidohydrolase family protein [Amycolatopsis sp. GM8]|uniref:amidohydrolase family protein n=1 Tax=Amycolatopsis sp. GM8 TaxID=2896530 RepID=UPI001F3FBC56|nr:amidohydrolase family protein [Amycolatopsis sp. GM8]
MLNGMIVADATAHCYNWSDPNMASSEAPAIRDAAYGFHQLLTGDSALGLTEQEFTRDWQIDEVADTLFFEAGVDFIGYHGTPIHDYWHDGHSATAKGYQLKERFPDRSLVYAAFNPFVLDSINEIHDTVDAAAEAGADGLKFYAARYDGGRTFPQRLDDEKYAFPAIERALERGIRVIATHKALPVGPVHYEPYGVSDLPLACATFPQMNFEVVHAGMAFVEESAFLAGSHPNCYFNLEISFATIRPARRRFAEFLGALLAAGAQDRILYASGISMVHPRIALDSFTEFTMPRDLVEECGVPDLTPDIRRGILGENYLRMHRIDPGGFRSAIADDAISRRQAAAGAAEPWSHLRRSLASTPEDAHV